TSVSCSASRSTYRSSVWRSRSRGPARSPAAATPSLLAHEYMHPLQLVEDSQTCEDRDSVPLMPAVIETHQLVKTFGSTRALDGLDLRVEAGEVHGFLGPNGAGKSTTIRVLLGLWRADSG